MKILPNGLAVLEGDQNASKWIAETGRLDYDREVDVLLPLLSRGDTVVDVGAMLGGFSGPFKKAVGESGTVHAFEPNPQAFACLERNCPGVVCHPCALGRCSGYLEIKLDATNPGGSFLQSQPGDASVPVFTLDEFARTLGGFSKCRLIKIDVEGMEPQVIEGAMDTLKAMRPILFVEINHGALARNRYNFSSVLCPLTSMGYRLEFISPEHSLDASRWPQVDVILKP